jgi:hypothetical protein
MTIIWDGKKNVRIQKEICNSCGDEKDDFISFPIHDEIRWMNQDCEDVQSVEICTDCIKQYLE